MDSIDYTFTFREKYLADQLDPEEKEAFEKELTQNPELLEALKEQIYLGNMLGEFLEETEVISSSDSGLPPKDISGTATLAEKKEGFLRRIFDKPAKVAAAIAFFLLCGWAIWVMGGPNEYQRIASKEFQHFSNKEVEGLDRVLGTPDPNDTTNKGFVDPIKYEAFEAYVKDDYTTAFDKLSTFIATGRDSSGGALFYRGICAMEMEQFREALVDFENYLDKYLGGDYVEDAMWYKTLAQLQEGKLSEAKIQLQELAKKGTRYRGRAADLLREMEE